MRAPAAADEAAAAERERAETVEATEAAEAAAAAAAAEWVEERSALWHARPPSRRRLTPHASSSSPRNTPTSSW